MSASPDSNRCRVIITGSTADPSKGTVECGLRTTPQGRDLLVCPKGHRRRVGSDRGLRAFTGLWDED